MRRLAAVSAAVSVSTAVMLSGCSSSSSSSPKSASNPPATANRIVIKNFAFSPGSLTVSPGAKITVTNEDTVAHTVTATGNKAFNTGDIAGGGTATFTAPTADGSYPYICSIHTYMMGTLVVK